jgi:hypothetical protein
MEVGVIPNQIITKGKRATGGRGLKIATSTSSKSCPNLDVWAIAIKPIPVPKSNGLPVPSN